MTIEDVLAHVTVTHGHRTTLAHGWVGVAPRDTYYNPILDDPDVVAEARLAPGDRYDPEIGRLLAAGRALERLGLRMQRRAAGLSKHADDVRAHRRQAKPRERDDEWHGIPPGGWARDFLCMEPKGGIGYCSRLKGHDDGRHVAFLTHDPAQTCWGEW